MVIISKRVLVIVLVGMQSCLIDAAESAGVIDTAATSTTLPSDNQAAQPDPVVPSAKPNEPNAQPEKPSAVPASTSNSSISTGDQTSSAPKPAIIPAPVEVKPESDTTENEEIGIDTIDLDEPQGNWLFKRVWWERAEAKYEKARKQTTAVLESRAKFFTQRSTIDRTVLDPFYLEIGLTRGQIQEIIQYLIDLTKQEQKSDSLEAGKERDFIALIQEEQKSLEQVALDIKAIGKADSALDDSLQTVIEQINKARKYEQDAWQNFKEIARVLDDNKARELYYKVDAAVRNISDIQDYISQSFSTYFDTLVSTIKDQTERVTKRVEELKQKGIDLKQKAQEIFAKEQDVKPVCPEPKKIEEPEEQEEPQGVISTYLVDPLLTVWHSLVSVVSWPYNALFGSRDEDDQSDDESLSMKTTTTTTEATQTQAPVDESKRDDQKDVDSMQKAPNTVSAE